MKKTKSLKYVLKRRLLDQAPKYRDMPRYIYNGLSDSATERITSLTNLKFRLANELKREEG
jgi:hypothetical protein